MEVSHTEPEASQQPEDDVMTTAAEIDASLHKEVPVLQIAPVPQSSNFDPDSPVAPSKGKTLIASSSAPDDSEPDKPTNSDLRGIIEEIRQKVVDSFNIQIAIESAITDFRYDFLSEIRRVRSTMERATAMRKKELEDMYTMMATKINHIGKIMEHKLEKHNIDVNVRLGSMKRRIEDFQVTIGTLVQVVLEHLQTGDVRKGEESKKSKGDPKKQLKP